MHKGYMGLFEEGDDRLADDMKIWEETGIAPSEYWCLDIVIFEMISKRLRGCVEERVAKMMMLSDDDVKELIYLADELEKHANDFTERSSFHSDWARLGKIIGKLWH